MATTSIMLLTGLVIGYLVIEQIMVTPPKFFSFYIALSAVLLATSVWAF